MTDTNRRLLFYPWNRKFQAVLSQSTLSLQACSCLTPQTRDPCPPQAVFYRPNTASPWSRTPASQEHTEGDCSAHRSSWTHTYNNPQTDFCYGPEKSTRATSDHLQISKEIGLSSTPAVTCRGRNTTQLRNLTEVTSVSSKQYTHKKKKTTRKILLSPPESIHRHTCEKHCQDTYARPLLHASSLDTQKQIQSTCTRWWKWQR